MATLVDSVAMQPFWSPKYLPCLVSFYTVIFLVHEEFGSIYAETSMIVWMLLRVRIRCLCKLGRIRSCSAH